MRQHNNNVNKQLENSMMIPVAEKLIKNLKCSSVSFFLIFKYIYKYIYIYIYIYIERERERDSSINVFTQYIFCTQ